MAFTKAELSKIRLKLYMAHKLTVGDINELVALVERETETDAPEEPLEEWRVVFIDMIREKRDLEAMELFREFLDQRKEPVVRKLLLLEPLAMTQVLDALERVLRWTARNIGSIGQANEDWINLRRTFIKVKTAIEKAEEEDKLKAGT